MQITIEYFAQLGAAARTSREQREVDDTCTVQDLLRQVADEHGPTLKDLMLDETGCLRRTVLLFVGDERVAWERPRPLRNQDVVVLATPVAGG